MAKSKLVKANKKIEKAVTEGYKGIEKNAVEGFQKMTDKFVDKYLTKDNESVKQAKQRLHEEQLKREKEQREILKNSDPF
ncbi:hypothetical protein ACKP2L_03675 [Oenococcus alcoholitolerans]|uniref:hypothetical protein n=1 Tax=Oenococcus alcoholitolerans TaxID=931074 RepID=UPI003F6F65B3